MPRVIRSTTDSSGSTDKALSKQVYEQLLDRMLDQRLRAGELITRRGVAADLGVSIAPVAEAFAALDRDGLLETLPRRGTRVRVFTVDDLRQQSVVRLALESQVARVVCGERVRKQTTVLRDLARTLDEPACIGHKRWQAEVRFHRGLAELCECDLLLTLLDNVLRLSFFTSMQIVVGGQERPPAASRHQPLLRQLQIDDPDAAEHAMRRHLLSGAIQRFGVDTR